MKQIDRAAWTKRALTTEIPALPRIQRSFAAASPMAVSLIIAVAAMLAGSPAVAACLQSGSTVTCSGASLVGFGTGVENNLAVTVQPDGSIRAATPVNLGSGNTVTNNGAVVVVGGGIGIQGTGNNAFTNAGTMALGSNSFGVYAAGNNNIIANSGAIS